MKAQASLEFMVVYSVLFMIFVVVFSIYLGGSLNLFQAQDSMAALRNAHSVAAAMNYVYLAGDGASYGFSLSNTKNEENITMSDYAVTSERPHASAGAPLLDAEVNVSSISRGDLVISNDGGVIHVVG